MLSYTCSGSSFGRQMHFGFNPWRRSEVYEIVWPEYTEAAEYKKQHNECTSHSRVLQYNFTIKWQFSSPCNLHSSYKLSSITRAAGTSTGRREGGTPYCRDSGRQTCGLRGEGRGSVPHTQFFHLSEWQALVTCVHSIHSFRLTSGTAPCYRSATTSAECLYVPYRRGDVCGCTTIDWLTSQS